MPFGHGKRRCPGQLFGEMAVKVYLTEVLKRFQVQLCDETEVHLRFAIISVHFLSAANGTRRCRLSTSEKSSTALHKTQARLIHSYDFAFVVSFSQHNVC